MSDYEEFAAKYLTGGEQVIEPARDPETGSWPSVIVRHGRFTAVVQFLGLGDHLCIDVHPFTDGRDARAGAFGMENGSRADAFTQGARGTSHGYPACRLVSVLIGEQAENATGDGGGSGCEGHWPESLRGGSMGATVYCDGSCQGR